MTYFIAKDKNGEIYLFDTKPTINERGWLKLETTTNYSKIYNINISLKKLEIKEINIS